MPNPWIPYAKRTLKLEGHFIPKIVRVVRDFRRGFAHDLQTIGKDQALSKLNQVHIDTDLTPLIVSIYRASGLLGAKMTNDEIKAQIRARDKAGGFGRNEAWVRAVMDYLKVHMLGFIQDITDTMREDIIKTLQKAVDEGWSIQQTVQELMREDLVRARAEVIARTEINRAANTGHAIVAQSLPYEVDKKWISAYDHRTRESHLIINGHTTDELGTFRVPIFKSGAVVGYDEMQFPGDPNASAANVCNCRCRVIYVVKRDAQGRLIMREPGGATVIPMNQVPRLTPAQIAAQLKANVYIGVKDL